MPIRKHRAHDTNKKAKKRKTTGDLLKASRRQVISRVTQGKAGKILCLLPRDFSPEAKSRDALIEQLLLAPSMGEPVKLSTVENRSALEGAITSVLTFKVRPGMEHYDESVGRFVNKPPIKHDFKWERCIVEGIDEKLRLVIVRVVDRQTGEFVRGRRFKAINKALARVTPMLIRVRPPAPRRAREI